jgi:hypothetical protein
MVTASSPTPAELQALILQLQTQVTTLTSGAATAGPAPAAVVFADTPQSLYADDLIEYSTKRGSSAQLETLKGHLKANKSLEDALNDDKKTRNKKNRGDKTRDKEDEAWKKIPPKDGDEKSKKMGKHTFHWCEHHMAWCMHHPSECRLGNQRKEEQSPTAGGNSATYAAAVASFAKALIASMQGRFNED